MKSLVQNNRLFIQYLSEFDILINLVEYYDWALEGVNNKLIVDLNSGMIVERINPLIKKRSLAMKQTFSSAEIFEKEIKRLIYNAQFTNAYTKLENTLIEICGGEAELKKIERYKDELDRIIKYLRHKKKLQLDGFYYLDIYKRIKIYKIIRNDIIHLNSKRNHSSLDYRIIKQNNAIYIDDSSYIIDFLNHAKSFLTCIISECNRLE